MYTSKPGSRIAQSYNPYSTLGEDALDKAKSGAASALTVGAIIGTALLFFVFTGKKRRA